MDSMQQIITSFNPISLEEMSGIRLMNRIDTKFITTRPMLCQLLQMARQEYMIQEIDGERNMLYHTTYYDTTDYDMFYVHQHGHANRQKMRFRSYVSSDLHFLEVKTKNNHGRTKKKRIAVSDMNIGEEQTDFLRRTLRYDAESLQPALENSFRRITLVNRQRTERLTIDTELHFHHLVSGLQREMDPLVIIELKRDGLSHSPILNMLRQLHIHPHGFSKYCMGSALTNPALQVNLFKPKLHDVERLLKNRRIKKLEN